MRKEGSLRASIAITAPMITLNTNSGLKTKMVFAGTCVNNQGVI
jgi:hypothetical protein